jgi:hypothetical protein
MIVLTSSELQNRSDVFVFQVRVVGEDLLSRGGRSQKIEDILHANAESADAWTTAAHIGIYGDSVNRAHVSLPLPVAGQPRFVQTAHWTPRRVASPGESLADEPARSILDSGIDHG